MPHVRYCIQSKSITISVHDLRRQCKNQSLMLGKVFKRQAPSKTDDAPFPWYYEQCLRH